MTNLTEYRRYSASSWCAAYTYKKTFKAFAKQLGMLIADDRRVQII